MTPEHQWLLQKERILAWLRLAFAVAAIAIIQLNPVRVARHPLLSSIALGSFLIYSLAMLYVAGNLKSGSKKIGLIASCLDLLGVSVIVFSTGGASTPFFAYYFFPIITASFRYGIKGAMSAGVAGVVIYGYIRFYFVWDEFLGIDRFAVRSIYLMVLAYMFGLLSEFETKQNQKLLALSKTAGELAAHEERRRISQELHDGLLQSLATHIVRLETCRRQFPELPVELAGELRSIENDTRTTMKTIRQFLAGKDTQPFPPGMLIEKLKDDLTFLRDGLGLRVILETEPESLNLPDNVEREVYYVIREGLMNISRHSHASRAELSLKQEGETIRGTLNDDGVGLNAAAANNGSGLGLQTMKERVKRLGGEFLIDSAPGEGTKISFALPLAQTATYPA